jgi:hypothetical protein
LNIKGRGTAPRLPKGLRRFVGRGWIVPPPVDELLPIERKLTQLLSRACPGGNEDDIGSLAFSLTILWEASKIHISHIRELTKTADEPDNSKLRKLINEIEINWVSNTARHLKVLGSLLSRFRAKQDKGRPIARNRKYARRD